MLNCAQELLFGFDSEVVPFPGEWTYMTMYDGDVSIGAPRCLFICAGLLSNESQKTNSEKNRYIEMYTGEFNS